MLRTTRPLLSSSARAVVPRGRPVCPPRAFTTFTSTEGRMQRVNGPRRPATLWPLVWRTTFATKPPQQPTGVDKELEKEIAKKKIEARPEEVSTQSSVRHAFEGSPGSQLNEQDITTSVAADLKTVKETIALNSVPAEPYALGLAGTLPYLATSISTLYLSWNLRTPWPTSSNLLNSFMVSNETAQQWLQHLEPIQLGYGAVIISFLGAVHWGMEFTEKTPSRDRTRFRYGIGVLAPAVAWPTLLMPVQFALTGQFAAFTLLYLADSRATSRGWTPPWYATYRFVLTFIVGSAIFISLVGRAKIGDDRPYLSTDRMADAMHRRGVQEEPYGVKWESLEAKEKEQRKKEEEEEQRKKEGEKKAKKAKKGEKKGEKKEEKKGKKEAKEDEEDEEPEEDSDGKDDSDDDAGDDEKDDGDKDSDDDKSDNKKGKDKKDGGNKDKQAEDAKDGGKKDDNKDDNKKSSKK